MALTAISSEQVRAGGDAGLEDGWKEAVDAASGHTYYYHGHRCLVLATPPGG